MILNRQGNPMSNVANAFELLTTLPEFNDLLCFDEMLMQPMIRRSQPIPLTDCDITDINIALQRAGLTTVGRLVTEQAAFRAALEHRYHPIRNRLSKLKWDGKPRLDRFAHVYLGAADTPYHRAIGSMFLLSMAARIFKPGEKCDYVLVLEGPQGRLKSTACEVLAGEAYFTDAVPGLDKGKEVSQHLRGKWIVELSELDAMRRADQSTLKAFFSRKHEKYRPPYGHVEVDEPRQCLFTATTNKLTYLKDETGNRRYWPLRCGTIDIEALRRDRDQLLAEACDQYRRGVQWWPDADTQALIEPEQEARYQDDPWHGPIAEFLTDRDRVTIPELAINVLGKVIGSVTVTDMTRISAILEKEHWISRRTKKQRWWEPMPP
jgi:predicted P-loop ATPase